MAARGIPEGRVCLVEQILLQDLILPFVTFVVLCNFNCILHELEN